MVSRTVSRSRRRVRLSYLMQCFSNAEISSSASASFPCPANLLSRTMAAILSGNRNSDTPSRVLTDRHKSESGGSIATRARTIREMVDRQADEAERVDTILNEWPAGPDREAAMGGIVNHLAWKNPAQAIEFARSWSYSDRAAVRRWNSDEPAFSTVQKRILLRIYFD